MNSFEQSGKGLKGLLISSVAVIGLSVGVAEGQVAGLQGVMEGGKYGVGTSLYMPFGSVSGGMPFVGVARASLRHFGVGCWWWLGVY